MDKIFKRLLFIFITIPYHLAIANNIYTTPTNINIKNRMIESNVRTICYNQVKCDTILVNRFYLQNNYTPVWISGTQLTPIGLQLFNTLKNSYKDGLEPRVYHINEIEALITQTNKTESQLVDLELSLTNGFFLYSSNMAFGQVNTAKAYPGWEIKKRNFNLIELLNSAVATRNLDTALHQIYPSYSGYYELRDQLNYYQKILAQNGEFKPIPNGATLKLKSEGNRVSLLNKRLVLTNELDPDKIQINKFGIATKKAITQFQKNHHLNPSGAVDKKTLQALNLPLAAIIKKIANNVDRMRYLPNNIESNYIWINIPDFTLKVIDNNTTVLSMPIVVGKNNTKSCILNSNIAYIEVNPYWTVPKSIAVKDILPKLKESQWYLESKGFIVYKNTIAESNITNPDKINWQNITPENFNYIFRQMPNKQNALGQLKFVFPNDCGIYLHDTPEKSLFNRNIRAYSHGCIRVSKPIELSLLLLHNKPQFTNESIESAINSGKRKIITITPNQPIHIVYFTTWVDESGVLQFRPDIYGLDSNTWSNK